MENLQVQCFHSTFFGSIPSISNISLLSAISQFELLLAQIEDFLSISFPANLRPEIKHHGWLASIIYSYIYCNNFFLHRKMPILVSRKNPAQLPSASPTSGPSLAPKCRPHRVNQGKTQRSHRSRCFKKVPEIYG